MTLQRPLRVLDADAHVVEPGGLFDRWSPPGEWPADLPTDTPMVPCGDAKLIADQLEHGFDALSYLRAMDAQGIDAAVLYPSIGLFVPYLPELEPKASASACRTYNEWIAEYCSHDPSRLIGIGLVPLAEPDLAADEARRAATLDLVGVLARPNHAYGRNLGDPAYDPLYAALVEQRLTLSVHEGLGVKGSTIGRDRFEDFAKRHACSHPMEQMAAMASLFLDGALDRHPDLRVAFLESGTGWLPYWLDRLDSHHEWAGGPPGRASEYFARQCVISTEPDDALVPWVAHQVGADHVMWASDFPHPDAIFPAAVTTFVDEMAEHGLSQADLETVLWDTPVRFYDLSRRVGTLPSLDP